MKNSPVAMAKLIPSVSRTALQQPEQRTLRGGDGGVFFSLLIFRTGNKKGRCPLVSDNALLAVLAMCVKMCYLISRVRDPALVLMQPDEAFLPISYTLPLIRVPKFFLEYSGPWKKSPR